MNPFTPALVATMVTLVAPHLLRRWLQKVTAKSQSEVDDVLVKSLVRIVRWLLILVVLMFVVQGFGLDLKMAFAGVGIITLAATQALGGAARGVLGNVFAGIQMAISPPFNLGETIEVYGVEGVVKKVTLSATTLVDKQDANVIIPNAKVLGDKIKRA